MFSEQKLAWICHFRCGVYFTKRDKVLKNACLKRINNNYLYFLGMPFSAPAASDS